MTIGTVARAAASPARRGPGASPPSSFVHVLRRRSADPRPRRVGDARRVWSGSPERAPEGALRVVVVDADRRVRRDLAQFVDLDDGAVVVGVADDVPSALALVEQGRPDVVVLDPRLPDLDAGLALVAQMRGASPARIVVLGNDPSLESRARAVGAHAFVSTCDPLTTLLAAIVRPGSGPPAANGDPDG